jgi:hypothetical protein
VSALWRALATRWDRFWFVPESPRNLGAARMLVAAHALWVLLSRDPAALSALPAVFWTQVLSSTRWRFLIWEGRPELEAILQWLAVAALAGAIAGVWPRACCLASSLLLYHLAPLETIVFTPSPWVKGFTLSVLSLLALSVSRCGDAWSLKRARVAEHAPAWEYGWPLSLARFFLCSVYFYAGWAKLAKTGWGWVSAESVQRYILQYAQNDQTAAFSSLGYWIADRPALCLAAAFGALLVDFGMMVPLVWRPARRLLPLVALWHAAIALSFNMAFLEAPLLLLFVDWEGLRRRLRAPARPGRS